MMYLYLLACVTGLVSSGYLPPQYPHLTSEDVDAKIAWLMEEVGEIRTENNDLKSRQNALENENKALKTTITALQKGKRYVAPGNPNSDAVAFYAQLTHSMGNVGDGQSIIFDKVITNEGTGYNPTTGVFTCKQAGIYVFFLNVMTHGGKYVEADVVKNGAYFMEALAQDSTGYDNGSNLGIVTLAVGDTVRARVHYHKSDQGDIIYPAWTTFSGFLLQPI